VLARAHESVYESVHRRLLHSRLISSRRMVIHRRHKRRAPSPLVHALSHRFAPRLLRVPCHPYAFSDRFPPLGRVYSCEELFIPTDPFRCHIFLSLKPSTRYRDAHTVTWRRRHRTGRAVVPVRYLVYMCMRATLWLRSFPQCAYIHFRPTPRPIFTCILSWEGFVTLLVGE
jgi:hypothetical protein